MEKKTFAEEVNEAFREAANGSLKGILGVSDEPLVSSDYKLTNVSSTIDSALTMVRQQRWWRAWASNAESVASLQ